MLSATSAQASRTKTPDQAKEITVEQQSDTDNQSETRQAATSKTPSTTHKPTSDAWLTPGLKKTQERLNREIRRRTDVVGIFPDRKSLIRLVGAVLSEQHDEWIEGRRYLGLDVLSRSRVTLVPTGKEETTTELAARHQKSPTAA